MSLTISFSLIADLVTKGDNKITREDADKAHELGLTFVKAGMSEKAFNRISQKTKNQQQISNLLQNNYSSNLANYLFKEDAIKILKKMGLTDEQIEKGLTTNSDMVSIGEIEYLIIRENTNSNETSSKDVVKTLKEKGLTGEQIKEILNNTGSLMNCEEITGSKLNIEN